jgi:hypothetical protein
MKLAKHRYRGLAQYIKAGLGLDRLDHGKSIRINTLGVFEGTNRSLEELF